MIKVNEDYLKLRGSYLFSDIAKKVKSYEATNPERRIIRLGIGDVTLPIVPSVIDALHSAVDEMAEKSTFKGYAPDLGYCFLRNAISQNDFKVHGCAISPDEIFVSDGAKSDCGNIQELFAKESVIAVCDPVYPVYVDSNVMAGRSGLFDESLGMWSNIVYMPCTRDNNFSPEVPKEDVDLIYLCFPNNPTGAVVTKDELQVWVDYANKKGSIIIFDAAYEAYISEENIPHSIYECEGAKTCAIEIHSFSKNAGFTGLRLGYTVVPKELIRNGVSIHSLWARRHGTKYNGAPYIIQKAGEAVYSEKGKSEIKEAVAYYMRNASYIAGTLKNFGFEVSGGINSPYIWLKTPNNLSSWELFDKLLTEASVVGTPGVGFGPHGEGYFRLTAFGDYEDTIEAVNRIRDLEF